MRRRIVAVLVAAGLLVGSWGPAPAEAAPPALKRGPADLFMRNGAFDFGPVLVGTSAVGINVLVKNRGGSDAAGIAVGQPSHPAVQVKLTTCEPTLVPGDACEVQLTVTPIEPGPIHGTVTVSSSNGGSETFTVHALGYADGQRPADDATIEWPHFRLGEVRPGEATPPMASWFRNTGTTPIDQIVWGQPDDPRFVVHGCQAHTRLGVAQLCFFSYRFEAIGPGPLDASTTVEVTADGEVLEIVLEAQIVAPPEAHADVVSTHAGLPSRITDAKYGLLGNDDGVLLEVTSATDPSHGDVDVGPDGTLTYLPDPGFTGTDGFTYEVSDGYGQVASAPVTVEVAPRTTSTNEAFTIAAYDDFLGRAPTGPERTTTVAALDAATRTRGDVVGDLSRSTEWIRRVVDDLYLDTLGRPGDPGGVAFWVERIRTGRMSVAAVAAAFYASGEYFRGFGASDPATWVTDLYDKLLGRSPDPAGLAHWVGRVATRGRDHVARAMFDSPESRRARVRALYLELLGRQPDATGLAYWSERILTRGDLSLAANLAASSEYLRRAQHRYP